MKKVVLLALLFCCTLLANAQFIIVPSGEFYDAEADKPYKVYSYEGKNKEELYIALKKNATRLFKSAKDVTSETENEALSFLFNTDVGGFESLVQIYIELKDGRIKVSGKWQHVQSSSAECDAYKLLNGSGPYIKKYRVFDKEGNVVNEKNLEKYSNRINEIVNSLITIETDEEDW